MAHLVSPTGKFSCAFCEYTGLTSNETTPTGTASGNKRNAAARSESDDEPDTDEEMDEDDQQWQEQQSRYGERKM